QHIDVWARLFKSTTWEELHMLTNELPIIDDVSKTVYKVTADEKARMELFARQDTLRRENDARLLRQRAEDALAKTQVELAETQSELVETKSELAETHSRLTKTQSELAEKMSENSNMQNEIIELKKRLSELESRQDLKQ
ncbi:MAG: hypothetical protein K6E56_06200, partial [Lachnospiraceae bacterium]|nr:hypothetical protein [Lachnospiraceae bacterium]